MVRENLLKYAAPRLKEYGFEYAGKNGPYEWVFTKEKEEVIDQIIFRKNRFGKDLDAELDSSLKGRVPIIYISVLNDLYNRSDWKYDSEASLIKAIAEIVDVVISKGLMQLEFAKIPDIESPLMWEQFLYRDHVQMSEEFIREYQLSFEKPDIQLTKLQGLILDHNKNSEIILSEVVVSSQMM